MSLDFYFDLVCPFAYLASACIERLAAEAGTSVNYKPILLGGLLKELGGSVDPNATMPAAKVALTRLDARRQAAWLGVPFAFPSEHPRKTLLAMRLLYMALPERTAALTHALYKAAWVEDRDIASRDVLADIARAHGMTLEGLDAPETKAGLRQATDEAAKQGVFGVPTFEVGETMLFGVDRLSFLREALSLDDAPLQGPPLARNVREARVEGPPQIEWFHDVASPFSYLASLRIEAMCARVGAVLVPRPIVVGALFREIGTPLVPLHTFSPQKQAWARQDMERCAERQGVPFVFPRNFPLRTLVAQRVLCLEPRAGAALYRAAWARDLDVSDPEVVRTVLSEAGFEADLLLQRAEQPQTKDLLRQHTERARSVGAVGVPSFLVDGTELFWGQDRMHHLEHAARGWRLDATALARDVPEQEELPS